jgi:hypothetical protein
MTKRSTKRAAGAAASEAEEPAARVVKYVVNRPYSAGEAPDIVDAEVTHEYEDGADLLRLKLIDPPRGVEEDQKRVRRSDLRDVGTWFEVPAEAEAPAATEDTNGAGA